LTTGAKGTWRPAKRAEPVASEKMPRAQKPLWTIGNGLPLGTWYYRISGVTTLGERLPSSAILALNAQGGIHVAWSDPPNGKAASYNIYRSLASDGRASTERLL